MFFYFVCKKKLLLQIFSENVKSDKLTAKAYKQKQKSTTIITGRLPSERENFASATQAYTCMPFKSDNECYKNM